MNTKVNKNYFDYLEVTININNGLYGFNHGNEIIQYGFKTYEEAQRAMIEYGNKYDIEYEL